MLKTYPENSDILNRLHAREAISHLECYFAVYVAGLFACKYPGFTDPHPFLTGVI